MTLQQDIAKICSFKTEYEELVSSMNVPASKSHLTMDTTLWFLEAAHRFNSKFKNYKRALEVCNSYIELSRVKYGNYNE